MTTPSPDDSSLPEWLGRPGAGEAVVVGADIRSRFSALLTESGNKSDEVCLQKIRKFDSNVSILVALIIV